MNEIYFITSTNVSGAQFMLKLHFLSLRPSASGHVVFYLFPDRLVMVDFRFEGGGGASFDLKLGQLYLTALAEMRCHLQGRPPDFIHYWMFQGCRLYWSALAGHRTNRPAQVWENHRSLQDIRNEILSRHAVLQLLSALTRRPEASNCCSKLSRRLHKAIVFALDYAVILSDAVDMEIFLPEPDAQTSLAVMCRVLVMYGLPVTLVQSNPKKDDLAMVPVAVRLILRSCDAQAVLFDEGHCDRPVISEAEMPGAADRLTALDLLDGVDGLVPGLDVFLLCSAWGEAFPLAAIDAMAAGVPFVVTDVGGCAHLVGKTGPVVPPSDPKAQADAVSKLFSLGREGRASPGAKARERVQKHYSTEIYRDQHEKLYREVSCGEAAQDKRSMSAWRCL